MVDRPPALILAELDAAFPIELDPGVFAANLAALRDEQSGMETALAGCELPAHWRPVRALDGSPTWRCEAAGQAPHWLGGSGIPRRRAAGRLASLELHDRTPGLCALGSGAELLHLLDQLPAYVPVYVFESDLHVLAAVLRLHDVSGAIRAGRCIFLPPEGELDALRCLLTAQPGLESPAEMLLPDAVSEPRLAELRHIGETINVEIARSRNARLEHLAEADWPTRHDAVPPRLAVLALHADPAEHTLAQLLADAAERLGWPILCHRLAGPRDAHALALCERLAAFRPTLTLCVNHACPPLPAALIGNGFGWLLTSSAAAHVDPQQQYLAASPAVIAELTRIGVASDRVVPWFWPAPAAALTIMPQAVDPFIVVVGDVPDAQPEACGIRQETHKILWRRALVEVTRTWESATIHETDRVLRAAETATGIRITDTDLRALFLSSLVRAAIPAQVSVAVAQACRAAGTAVVALGRGWERLGDGVRTAAPHVYAWSERDAAAPLACVSLAWPEPFDAALVYAAARGWPLLVWHPGGRLADLGRVLRPEVHYEPFSGLRELERKLKSLRGTRQPQVERARALVAAQHTCERRLEELAVASAAARSIQ